jgi:hypothetical protein
VSKEALHAIRRRQDGVEGSLGLIAPAIGQKGDKRIFADWLFLVDGDVRFWSTTTVRIMTSSAAPSGEPIKVYWQPG